MRFWRGGPRLPLGEGVPPLSGMLRMGGIDRILRRRPARNPRDGGEGQGVVPHDGGVGRLSPLAPGPGSPAGCQLSHEQVLAGEDFPEGNLLL
jgi:hypothetical protein